MKQPVEVHSVNKLMCKTKTGYLHCDKTLASFCPVNIVDSRSLETTVLHPCGVVTSGTGIRKVVSLAMDGQDISVASVDDNDVRVGAARASVDRMTTCNFRRSRHRRGQPLPLFA